MRPGAGSPTMVCTKRLVGVVALLAPASLCGQQALSTGPATPAATYLDRYREVRALAPLPGQVGEVRHLVVQRRNFQLTLGPGTLYVLSPVGGRTIGVVYQGTGRFTFAPADPTERAELTRHAGSPKIDDAISEAILLFADSTATLFDAVPLAPGEVPGSVADHVADFIGSLRGDEEGSLSDDIMSPLLNGEASEFFVARVERVGGSPLLYRFDPDVNEAEQLHRPVGRRRWGANWTAISRAPSAPGADTWWHRRRLDVPHYTMDVHITPSALGELDFAARSTLSMTAAAPVGPWLRFTLHPKVEVDSGRWGNGEPTEVFKAKDDATVWVRAAGRLEVGDTLSLTLFYRGDLIDRYGDWFFVDPLADWYPVNGQGGNLATFDLTFHTPGWYPLASIGDRVDSSLENRVLTTRWVERRPTPYASFNLGIFERERIEVEGVPPVDVFISEDAHRALRREALQRGVMIPQQRNMREVVVADVTNSLKLFTSMLGDAPFSHFSVTEVPYLEGVSFPALIHLSWSTFQETSLDGFDQFFRAHEVAHQWWGNAVRPASYRDAWLSEGLATFMALRYLQDLRKRNDVYFRFLDSYRTNIRGYRGDVGPTWIGYRNATPSTPLGYQIMVYEKGAWVFHMLRTLMFDLQTRSDARFNAMMRDFYETYRERSVTTEQFRQLVERHAGVPMDWFFDAWIKGTGVPTYRVAWTTEAVAEGKHRVRLRITQDGVPAEFKQFVLVSVDLGNDRFAHFRLGVHGGQTEYLSPLLPAEPKSVSFNELHSVLADVKTERW